MLRCVTVAAVAAASVFGGCAASAAEPLPKPAGAMRVGAEILAPYAFYDFCRRTPHECQPDSKAGAPVELDQKRWAELVEVNMIVNTTVIPMSDMQNYGVADYWAIAAKYGDCEDYALTKQLYLRQRGWPMGTLLMTVVRDENGEGHAVLTVRTSKGDFVLDNRQPRIVAWTQTPYKFIKRQSTRDPQLWLTLDQRPATQDHEAVATLRPHK
jgi:predicted transglutaminase-like cysteine proteinase